MKIKILHFHWKLTQIDNACNGFSTVVQSLMPIGPCPFASHQGEVKENWIKLYRDVFQAFILPLIFFPVPNQ